MIKVVSTFIALCLLTHCTSNQQTNVAVSDTITTSPTKEENTASTIDTTLKLDRFITMPKKIGGCGEYFTYDTSVYVKENYIFLSNLSAYALIRVKGKDVYLTKDSVRSQSVNNKSYTAVYRGQGYTVVLKMQQTKAYDEGGFYAGTLEIERDGVKVRYTIHGEAGC